MDCDGRLMGARVASDGQWRFQSRNEIPEKVKWATLVFEDRYFYHHPGVNPVSIAKAAFRNLKAGSIVSGGSTITMQIIRLSRKGKPRNIWEKAIESILATRLELGLSKDEVLSLYLAHAPYGGNVVGVEAASWRYFGVAGKDLSWAEAATLAVLPNSPSLIHPGRNRELLNKKRNLLLARLCKLHWIDSTTLSLSLAEPIPERPSVMPRLAPHLLDRCCREHQGEVVNTTLLASLQEQASGIIEQHHNKLRYNEINNIAAIIIEVETGNILTYIGNTSGLSASSHGNEVDVITAPRSTGSLLKPLLYAAMLDDGKILPASLVPDIPVNLGGFSPQNFSGQFEGAIPANRALSRSLNVPAVDLLKQFGVQRFHHLLRDLGMQTINHPADYYGLSLILGGAEGTLQDMSNIYASLTRVLNHYGQKKLYFQEDYRPAGYLRAKKAEKIRGSEQHGYLSAAAIWFAYQAMIEVNRPDAEAGWNRFLSARRIAWKTGTSFGYRDGWAIGTSAAYVVGVWAGNADGEGRPGLTGIGAAAPIMFDLFSLLPAAEGFVSPTDELVIASICQTSGFLAGDNCPYHREEKVPVSCLKSPLCPFHKVVHLTEDGQYRVTGNCYPVSKMQHVSWFVLPPVQEWYYKKHHTDYRQLPPYHSSCQPDNQRSMDMIYPREEVQIFIPRTLDGSKGRVVFEAVHTNPNAFIYWHLDDQFVTVTRYIHQVELLPEPGRHRLVLVDGRGEELVRSFEAVEP
ncbi:MAG: penicillin-binding protein 1C [Bacteroidales bacterium]|nr:penicillin-binding protein 1C [Bacteroidales bacterium]